MKNKTNWILQIGEKYTIEELRIADIQILVENQQQAIDLAYAVGYKIEWKPCDAKYPIYVELNTNNYPNWNTLFFPMTNKTINFNQVIMENKKIIGYKLIKPEYEQAAALIYGGFRIHRLVSDEGDLKKLKEAKVLDIWFEPVWSNTKIKLILSNGKEVNISKEGVEAEGKIVKIKYLENLFCNTNTFGDTGWNIQYNSFDIGCYKNLTRNDLNKIIESYKSL